MIVVCGGGGFIGGHLVLDLIQRGHESVRAIDCKPLSAWQQLSDDAESLVLDPRRLDACRTAVDGARTVFNLAADMGGMGFIESNRALCMLNALINTHLLEAISDQSIDRFFFASSACVYNVDQQRSPGVNGLRECDAYPANPEDGYGWEKLVSERMCRHFSEDFGVPARVARLHNIYGPHGVFEGGREKAPAALCRKFVLAKKGGHHEIEIWGNGEQSRSFTYVDDCLEGIVRFTESSISKPLNLGSCERVTINQLVDQLEVISGIRVKRSYITDAPFGVSGRNSDNRLILS